MAEAISPVWRAALTNRDHDLYEAAWTLFGKKMNIVVADKRMQERKDAVIPLLVEIIEDEDLYERRNLGGGIAPLNAVRLIEKWGLKEQLPMLLEVLEQTASYQKMYSIVISAIASFGSEILDDILNWVEKDQEMRPEAAQILSKISDVKTKNRIYDIIFSWIEPDEFNLLEFAEALVKLDPERAVGDLRILANNSNFERDERTKFRDLSKDARKVARERQKAAKAAAKAQASQAEIPSAESKTTALSASATDEVTNTDGTEEPVAESETEAVAEGSTETSEPETTADGNGDTNHDD